MQTNKKVNLYLVFVFLILLISLVWSGNEQYSIKLKVSLALVLSVGAMIGAVLAVLKWKGSRILAYITGLITLALGYIVSGYLMLGKIDVIPAIVGLAIGLLLIPLKICQDWGNAP